MSKCKRAGGWDMIGGQRIEEGGKDQRSYFQFFLIFNRGTTSFSLLLPSDGWQGSRFLCSVGMDLDTRQTDRTTKKLTDLSSAITSNTPHLSPQQQLGVCRGTNWLNHTHHPSVFHPRTCGNCMERSLGPQMVVSL